jgi:hypothetical protein
MLVDTVVAEVQRHSGSTPSDDFTLIVARGQGQRDHDAVRTERRVLTAVGDRHR